MPSASLCPRLLSPGLARYFPTAAPTYPRTHAPSLTTLATLLQGRLLADRYRIGAALGFGGMGAVFRAHDERLGRDVAVKVLTAASADPGEQEVLRARFRREARAAAALRHPNVVTVHDFGTDAAAGLDFLVMELLPGIDVAARLAEAGTPLSPDEVLEIVREAAMGLAAGHRGGLVHRDVKPRNLFLVADPVGGWEVKVLDFGIAQLAAGDDTESRLTRHGPSPHTPRYAAPEQLAASPHLTPACDVYALGMVALEMLSGRYIEGLNTSLDDSVAARAVDALRGRAGAPVCDALLRMLRRDPAQRPADADSVLRLLGPPARTAADAAPTLAFVPPPVPADRTVAFAPPPSMPPPAAVSYTPPPMPPPAAVSYTPQPAYTVPPAPVYAQPAAPAEEPEERRSGSSALPKLVGVVGLIGLAALFWPRGEDRTEPEAPPAVTLAEPEAPAVPPEVAASRELANQEALRAVRLRGGIGFGEKLWIVVASTRAADEVERAVALRDRITAAGHPAGLANGRVYPELDEDSVAVVAGPFDRDDARAALPAIRRLARGARLREVTFQVPR